MPIINLLYCFGKSKQRDTLHSFIALNVATATATSGQHNNAKTPKRTQRFRNVDVHRAC